MKLVEKYLYAISKQLPKDSSDEVITELKTLLYDTLEDNYGPEPTEEQISQTLMSFGSPSAVAKEYGKSRYVINPQLTDIYLLIAKIIGFAMLGAFSIVFIVQLFTEDDVNIALGLLGILGNALNATIASIGSLTVVFILISRYMGLRSIEDGWTPKDLEELPKDKEAVSYFETFAGIVFSVVFIIGFNLFPEIINLPVLSLSSAGFDNMHMIDMNRFLGYLPFLNILWIGTILRSIYTLVRMRVDNKARVMDILLDIGTVALFYVMLTDFSLYVGPMNFFGFRGLFLLVSAITAIEIISSTVTLLKRS